MTLDHADIRHHLQNLADELAAEASYEDLLAHPETVVDAFDLFDDDEPALDADGNFAVERQQGYDPCHRCRLNPCPHYGEGD